MRYKESITCLCCYSQIVMMHSYCLCLTNRKIMQIINHISVVSMKPMYQRICLNCNIVTGAQHNILLTKKSALNLSLLKIQSKSSLLLNCNLSQYISHVSYHLNLLFMFQKVEIFWPEDVTFVLLHKNFLHKMDIIFIRKPLFTKQKHISCG